MMIWHNKKRHKEWGEDVGVKGGEGLRYEKEVVLQLDRYIFSVLY